MSKQGVRKLGVIGAGNMGSGIAQKMATEGFEVVLVDLDQEKVGRGLSIIKQTLTEGVERRIFKPDQAEAIGSRIRGTADWSELGNVDLVVEAVFENLEVKRKVFTRLEEVCKPDAILGTNTSSFLVDDVAEGMRHPERIVGLHYFYHPAKNRLVEVIPGSKTSEAAVEAAWSVQEQMGKTAIASADASGFVVNRYFVPWLNEAVRLVEDGTTDIPTVEAACKKAFGVGMGPFELMNVTGVPIALHAATTLEQKLGPFYAPTGMLAKQVDSGENWNIEGQADESKFEEVSRRMLAVVFYVASALVDEQVGSIEDTDIGARVGLRWPRGPFQMMNRTGVNESLSLVQELTERWELQLPLTLVQQAKQGAPFTFDMVRTEMKDGIARLTINRPDAMNALNETVVEQLDDAFRDAAADSSVKGIVIGGAGKAFIAGADIRFFVRNIESKDFDRIVRFTRAGQDLLNAIDECPKPVVARMDGLALGGGLELALACDARIATPKVTLAFPETGIGIYPGLGGTQRTSRLVGTGLAKWLIYTGQMLGAAESEAIGLVDAVVEPDQLEAKIREIIAAGVPAARTPSVPERYAALNTLFDSHRVDDLRQGKVDTGGDERLAKVAKKVGFKAPVALRLSEKLIEEGSKLSLREGLEMEMDHLLEIFGTADAYEGLSTLGRKRPEFKGS